MPKTKHMTASNALTTPEAPPHPAQLGYRQLEDRWSALTRKHASAVTALVSQHDLTPMRSVRETTCALIDQAPDGSLYHLIYLAAQEHSHYSDRHALLTMTICRLSAALLGWSEGRTASVELAALSMNAAMAALQDRLASSGARPSLTEKSQIDQHSSEGAQLLRVAGLADEDCIAAVSHHHEPPPMAPPEDLPPSAEVTVLLRMVDIFAAKLSRRGPRIPVSPLWAARETCLLTDAGPDRIGAAVIKALGLYPPGTFVKLANREQGIVYRRGMLANNPMVAVMLDRDGMPGAKATLRDTSDPRFAVASTVRIGSLKHRPPHEQVFPGP
jgi:hypothetical protein